MPVPQIETANWGDLLTTTLKVRQEEFVDNIFQSNVLLTMLKRTMKMQAGGEQIAVELMYRTNATSGSIGEYDVIDTTPQEGLTAALYQWRLLATTITISGLKKNQNMGKSQAISLVEARLQQAQMSAAEDLSTQLNADGTGNGGKDFNGLQNLVANDPSTGTVGGISRATNSWWQNRSNADLGLSVAGPHSFASLGVDSMRTMVQLTSRGGGGRTGSPDLIYTSEAIYRFYYAEVQPHLRTQNTALGDLGFRNLEFEGIPVVHSEQAPSGNMYFLNTAYLMLKMHPNQNFSLGEEQEPYNQFLTSRKLITMGNLCLSQARKQGVITGLVA